MKKLYIHNFGPVKDADVEIKRFNLFIGEQSIGKSTIAKLITIFTDYLNIAFLSSEREKAWLPLLENYDLLSCIASSDYKVRFEDVTDSYCISLTFSTEEIFSSIYRDGKELKDQGEILSLMMKLKPIYHHEFLLPKSKKLSEEQILKHVTENFCNSIYVPAERIIGSIAYKLLPAMMMAKEQIPNNLLRFITDLNNAKAKYTEFSLDLLNVTYKVENDNEYIVLENGKPLLLRNASSGMQSLIPLILVLTYGKENTQYESFVVEEPECNLFPEKQKQLLEMLMSDIYHEDRTLTITTHSPYLLSALNNYLYAGIISEELGTGIHEELKGIIEEKLWLHAIDCSVYSLGEEINNGDYCKSIIEAENGLIDFNYLDGVSIAMGNEFSKLQRLYVKEIRKQKKVSSHE